MQERDYQRTEYPRQSTPRQILCRCIAVEAERRCLEQANLQDHVRSRESQARISFPSSRPSIVEQSRGIGKIPKECQRIKLERDPACSLSLSLSIRMSIPGLGTFHPPSETSLQCERLARDFLFSRLYLLSGFFFSFCFVFLLQRLSISAAIHLARTRDRAAVAFTISFLGYFERSIR